MFDVIRPRQQSETTNVKYNPKCRTMLVKIAPGKTKQFYLLHGVSR